MGQVNMSGGHGGDAPQEHPQRQGIAWESCEEEECIGGGEEDISGSSGAEVANRGGQGEGTVIWWTSVRCKLHWICNNTKVTQVREDRNKSAAAHSSIRQHRHIRFSK